MSAWRWMPSPHAAETSVTASASCSTQSSGAPTRPSQMATRSGRRDAEAGAGPGADECVNLAAGVSYTMASKGNGVAHAARYAQLSLKQGYRLSKRTELYALEAWQHASGQTLDSTGQVVNAAPAVGDSQNLTGSSTPTQIVAMLGIDMSF